MPGIGLFIDQSQIPNPNFQVKERDLMKGLSDFLLSRRESVHIIRMNPKWKDLAPFYWEGYELQQKYTYHLDLTQDLEELFQAMDGKLRRQITKADENELTLIDGLDRSAEFQAIITGASGESSSGFQEQVVGFLSDLKTHKGSRAIAIEEEGNVIASAVLIVEGETGYYLFGGADKSASASAGAVAIWNSIAIAKKEGAKTFDFEGSMIKGVEHFFRQFGGTQTSYVTLVKMPVAFSTVMDALGRRV
ncbi:MAG: peptidoglycan bridge formation glycyltransferase FemA/FemB family protein [Flavobacteriales bacterium]|nr:peptidoglycan bridge formation glycyltransferase FemA/FemB family protein [Flavobacteriales bacterium]